MNEQQDEDAGDEEQRVRLTPEQIKEVMLMVDKHAGLIRKQIPRLVKAIGSEADVSQSTLVSLLKSQEVAEAADSQIEKLVIEKIKDKIQQYLLTAKSGDGKVIRFSQLGAETSYVELLNSLRDDRLDKMNSGKIVAALAECARSELEQVASDLRLVGLALLAGVRQTAIAKELHVTPYLVQTYRQFILRHLRMRIEGELE